MCLRSICFWNDCHGISPPYRNLMDVRIFCLYMIDSCFDLVLFQSEVLQWFGSYCPICVAAAESPCVSSTCTYCSLGLSSESTVSPSILKKNLAVFPLSVLGNCLGPAKVPSITPEPLAEQPQRSFQDPLFSPRPGLSAERRRCGWNIAETFESTARKQ